MCIGVRAAWTDRTRRPSHPTAAMELPLYSATRVETELDTLLVNIEIIALTRAREIVAKHAVGDVAHDAVLHCCGSTATMCGDRSSIDVASSKVIRFREPIGTPPR
jgi:hypothetical protein